MRRARFFSARPDDRARLWVERAATLLIGLLAIWYALFLLIGDSARYFGYLNALGFWLGLAAVVAGLALGVCRRWLRATAGVGLGVAILWHGIGLSPGRELPAGAQRFRLITASLRNLNDDMASVARNLLAEKPDVLVVQEAHVAALANEIRRLGGAGWQFAWLRNEMIFCRCAVRDVHATGTLLSATLDLPRGAVRVWNVRAPKTYSRTIDNRLYFADMMLEMGSYSGARIAAGDFNATPWNDGYRLTAAVARDAWMDAALGPSLTFPTPARHSGVIPTLSIDHVFYAGGLTPLKGAVLPASPGQDHFPVRIDFAQ